MKKLITMVVLFTAILFGQASDDANQAAYSSSFTNGLNGGSGFLAWSITNNDNNSNLFAGSFIGSSTSGAGDIDVSGKSFSLYANPGGAFINADRGFVTNLAPGERFSFKLALNYANGNKGFNLFAGTMGEVFNFNVGSSSSVSSNNATLNAGSGTGYDYGGKAVITVTIDVTTASSFSYSISRTSPTGFQGVLFSGTVTGLTESLTGFRFYNSGTDNGDSENNLYFNSLSVAGFEPTLLASNISKSDVGTNVNLSWTNGDGSKRIVVLRQGSAVSFTPVDGNPYTANSNFSSAAEVGPAGEGNKVVYDGTGTSVSVSGLSGSTTYHLAVYEYNGAGTGINYMSTALTSDHTTGVLPVELTSFTSSVSGATVQLNWATATEVDNYGFEVERSVDNVTFSKIGFVAGAGNSNVQKQYGYSDANLATGTYYYRLKQVDTDGSFEYSQVVKSEVVGTPTEFSLSQNYPNPFNPSTAIAFALPKESNVKLSVYNMLGEEVAVLVNGVMSAGNHSVDFSATNLNSGMYVYRIEAGELSGVRKMTLLK